MLSSPHPGLAHNDAASGSSLSTPGRGCSPSSREGQLSALPACAVHTGSSGLCFSLAPSTPWTWPQDDRPIKPRNLFACILPTSKKDVKKIKEQKCRPRLKTLDKSKSRCKGAGGAGSQCLEEHCLALKGCEEMGALTSLLVVKIEYVWKAASECASRTLPHKYPHFWASSSQFPGRQSKKKNSKQVPCGLTSNTETLNTDNKSKC